VASVVITAAVIGYSMLVGNANEERGTAGDTVTSGVTSGVAGIRKVADTAAELASRGEGASQLGETRHRPNSDTTLLQVRKVFDPDGRTAPAGMEWYGIRARTCMHADARASGSVPWSQWVVVTESGKRYTGREAEWTDFPPQQYSTDRVGPGKCNVGWVLVEVPRGPFREVVMVAFRPSSPDVLEWAV
jgi:hypothetical protein